MVTSARAGYLLYSAAREDTPETPLNSPQGLVNHHKESQTITEIRHEKHTPNYFFNIDFVFVRVLLLKEIRDHYVSISVTKTTKSWSTEGDGFLKKAQNSPADEGCASIKKVYVLINIFNFLWFQY